MEQTKLRAWYSHRQGLDGSLAGAKPADILARTGWARSVGGSAPYLTLFARGGISREQADAAVANLDIHELPSARGCTYVLPAADFALGLAVGRTLSQGEMKVALKLGVTDKEIKKLCDAVRNALEPRMYAGKVALSPDEIRDATGNASRSLGEEGKKKGVSTTLPLALGKLQTEGEIRRVPINGRLDQQRYKYIAWRPSPLKGFKRSDAEAAAELARRYFTWIAPAAISEFQAFAGLGVKADKEAAAPLKLEPVEAGSDRLMLPEDRSKFASFKPPKDAQYSLVSSLDGIALLRNDLKGLVDAADLTPALSKDLPSHAILDRGRLIGLWEFDTATSTIAWRTFIKKNRDLEKAVARAEQFVREQLGDARSFSLDSPASRAPRVEALRKAAGES